MLEHIIVEISGLNFFAMLQVVLCKHQIHASKRRCNKDIVLILNELAVFKALNCDRITRTIVCVDCTSCKTFWRISYKLEQIVVATNMQCRMHEIDAVRTCIVSVKAISASLLSNIIEQWISIFSNCSSHMLTCTLLITRKLLQITHLRFSFN